MDSKIAKQIAGEKAVDFIEDGMVVGLGTGSTATFMITKLGERVSRGLNIKAVSTSSVSSSLARQAGIPLLSIDEVESIDVTIDGADEVDPDFNGIKGGGGALLFEKIVARASKRNIWVVDKTKMVNVLGRFPVPVEVVPFGYRHALKRLEEMGLKPRLRLQGGDIYKTDSRNYIIDLYIEQIEDAASLDMQLNHVSGVVENGLFVGIVDVVVSADDKEYTIHNKP